MRTSKTNWSNYTAVSSAVDTRLVAWFHCSLRPGPMPNPIWLVVNAATLWFVRNKSMLLSAEYSSTLNTTRRIHRHRRFSVFGSSTSPILRAGFHWQLLKSTKGHQYLLTNSTLHTAAIQTFGTSCLCAKFITGGRSSILFWFWIWLSEFPCPFYFSEGKWRSVICTLLSPK